MNFKTCMHVLKEWFLYYCDHRVLYLIEFYLAWFLKFLLLFLILTNTMYSDFCTLEIT